MPENLTTFRIQLQVVTLKGLEGLVNVLYDINMNQIYIKFKFMDIFFYFKIYFNLNSTSSAGIRQNWTLENKLQSNSQGWEHFTFSFQFYV